MQRKYILTAASLAAVLSAFAFSRGLAQSSPEPQYVVAGIGRAQWASNEVSVLWLYSDQAKRVRACRMYATEKKVECLPSVSIAD